MVKIKKKVLTILILMFILLTSCKSNISIGEIKKFNFSQRNGYNPYGDMIYEINFEEGVYHAAIKPSNTNTEEILLTELDKATIDKIKQLLVKYDIVSWNGFSKYDDRVMDGTDFKLDVEFFNGDEIEASGYMMWPNNYHKFREEISILLDERYERNKNSISN